MAATKFSPQMYLKNLLKKLTFIILLTDICACNQNAKKPIAPLMPDSLSVNQAIKEISKQIEAKPDIAELYYQRAQIYYNEKYLGFADADLNYALYLDSTNALYWFMLARVNYAMNQTKNAAKYYENAIKYKPDYNEAKLKLADLYFLVKEYQKSIALLHEVRKTDNQNAYVYHMLGMNYRELGDTLRAINYFQTAIENDPTDYESTLYIANLYAAQLKNIALEYYKAAIKIKPYNTDAFFSRAVFYQKIKQYKAALLDYKIVIDRDPQNFLCYYNVGYINFETDKLDEALRNFNIATRMNPDFTEAYYMKGLIYEMQKKRSDAILNYEYALKISPDYTLAKEGLKRLR
jgi:tetratricopeptide (TPR) repeat protein